jgi:glycerophosphoryl diester phosphodiesterase
MKIFAHRGISAHYPENSQTAIKQCDPSFMTGVEIDLFQSGNEFIVIHDRWLTRLFDVDKKTIDLSEDDIASIVGNDGHPIPTLEWLITELTDKSLILNIELKKIRNISLFFKKLILVCDKVNFPMENLIISSFNHVYLKKLYALDQRLKLGLLLTNRPIDMKKYLTHFKVFSIHLDMDCVNNAFLHEVKALGTEVYIFTIDHAQEIQWCYQNQVDGIFANDPKHAFNLIKKLQQLN